MRIIFYEDLIKKILMNIEMKYIIANWKMNLPSTKIENYYNMLDFYLSNDQIKIIVAPPISHIKYLVELDKNIKIASQDVSLINEEFGPYTGEISAKFLKFLGVEYAIVGHSESRLHKNESNKTIVEKSLIAINSGITPVICIGEPLHARKYGKWRNYLKKQIDSSIPISQIDKVIIAYEPLWAIGSNEPLAIDELAKTIDYIRDYISSIAKEPSIIYGGAVKTDNSKQLSKIASLNGLIVGSASLNLNDFQKIVDSYA
ncbi:MAG: triose-phosphate isomerase family protein [Rickettsiaceae bacterium]|nr:triose-phosphate isomerase family protein [Rickettsiaceae bacterium]